MDLQELLSKVDGTLTAGRSFGPAYDQGGTTLIPVSVVIGGGGGGSGDDGHHGTGSGGGFGSVSWPIGAYEIKDGAVRWVPALDATRVAVALIGAAKLLVKLRARARERAER